MLIFKLVTEPIRRYQRGRLRSMMRGYRILKNSGRLDCIAKIKEELTLRTLNINTCDFSPAVMGAGSVYGELIVRQYLLLEIGGVRLNGALLLSAGGPNARVSHAMPPEWCDVIERHGFKVSRLGSKLLWVIFLSRQLIYGILKIIKVAGSFFGRYIEPNIVGPYVYFSDLGFKNLPKKNDGYTSRNIVSWYEQWIGRAENIKAIHHSVLSSKIKSFRSLAIAYQPTPLPGLISSSEFIVYIGWGARATVTAVVDFVRGKWWTPLLLNQAALSAQVRTISPNRLASEYFFHNSNWIYRPIWTYDAEKFGALINFYFYSINVRRFNNSEKCLPPAYGWQASSWPYYLVWNKDQEDLIRKNIGAVPQIKIVGDIWFEDDETIELNLRKPQTVAVFDVQPFRDSKYQLLGLEYEYYVPKISIDFISDIQAVLDEFGMDMAIKRKREIGNLIHPSYQSAVEALGAKSNVVNIHPAISASRLIEKAAAVISMPYTSTAQIALNIGKPSIYYDSDSNILRDNCAAQGIEVIIGREQLREWVIAHILHKI
jgi:polysaccharide biosynthesis PFTS motif protein